MNADVARKSNQAASVNPPLLSEGFFISDFRFDDEARLGQPALVNHGWGDLFQIAALDTPSNAAKQEIRMIELKKFQLRLVKSTFSAFNFEQASLALMTRYQRQSRTRAKLPIRSEWRDPVSLCRGSQRQMGGRSHG
jgi:hypothetical protein